MHSLLNSVGGYISAGIKHLISYIFAAVSRKWRIPDINIRSISFIIVPPRPLAQNHIYILFIAPVKRVFIRKVIREMLNKAEILRHDLLQSDLVTLGVYIVYSGCVRSLCGIISLQPVHHIQAVGYRSNGHNGRYNSKCCLNALRLNNDLQFLNIKQRCIP